METRVQDHVCRQAFGGRTAVAQLAQENLLGPNVSLPHSIWLTDRDVERIAEAGAVPVHNPAANLRLGSGLSPIRKLLSAAFPSGWARTAPRAATIKTCSAICISRR